MNESDVEEVLDASALLAALRREPGADRVDRAVNRGAAIGTVNLAEVVAKVIEQGGDERILRQRLRRLALRVIPFDEELAYATARLRPLTRHLGLSLGDRACLALAQRLGMPALTADRTWAPLQLGIAVEVIR